MLSRHRRGLTLIELMAVIAVIGILMALLLPALEAGRVKSRRNQCMNNLKLLGLAMLNYESANGSFPIGRTGRNGPGYPAVGDPLGVINRRTWTFAVLPYMESSPLYNQINFNLGFNDTSNATVVAIPVQAYVCPADRGSANFVDPGLPTRRFKGNYVVNWGNTHYEQAAALDPFSGPLGKVTFEGAPFKADIPVGLSAFTGGTAYTLLMSEVLNPNSKNGASDRRGDIYNDDPNAAMFMAYSPPNAKTPDQMPPLDGSTSCVYPWGTNPPCNASAPAFNAARSSHPGGVFVLMADGSVRFVKDSVSIGHWRQISWQPSRNEGGQY